jgi:hypothetical protein
MTPNIDIVGSLKLIAYAPLEYGYKVSKLLALGHPAQSNNFAARI